MKLGGASFLWRSGVVGFLACAAINASTAPVTPIHADRWMEIDLYWFEQTRIPQSAAAFWDRFQPLYERVSGWRGVILNIGWTVGYIMDWSGDPNQRIPLPTGSGQQPWVPQSAPLSGTTAERREHWRERFSHPTVVERHAYEPWTYAQLHQLTDALRAEAARRGIAGLRVGSLAYAWTDAYGEQAPWALHHPEAFTPITLPRPATGGINKYFDPNAGLHSDSARLGGLPHGIREGMPAHAAFAAQWGSLSKAVGLDALMLRDSFGMPVPYRRGGPLGDLMPSPGAVHQATTGVAMLLGETKRANPNCLLMMYSNAASAAADWRANGLDLETVAREGSLDIFVDQTWAGAWNEVGVRHDNFWNAPTLGWTYQLAYMLLHSAVLAPSKVRHYPLVETFDAWESWDVLHTVPQRLRWGIWAYSHAAVKTPGGLRFPEGTYISWANQGKRLLAPEDVSFLAGNINAAVADAAQTSEVYGPTLVYSRASSEWRVDHAAPNLDVKEWIDEQAGSLMKWPVPILSATRSEWLAEATSDLFILQTPVHETPSTLRIIGNLVAFGQPVAVFGEFHDGIDPSIAALAGISALPPGDSSITRRKGSLKSVRGPAFGVSARFETWDYLPRNSAAPAATEVIYTIGGSPALVRSTTSGRRLVAWDPPVFSDSNNLPLLEIWGGSAAPYALAAGALNQLISGPTHLHAFEIDANQTMSVSAWKSRSGVIHILAANLEEGLRDDAEMHRSATLELPSAWADVRLSNAWGRSGTLHSSTSHAQKQLLIGLEQAQSALYTGESRLH